MKQQQKLKVRDLLHREQITKTAVDALNLKATDLVNSRVAAAMLGLHEVTVRAMRSDDPPRGPPYIKDLSSGLRGPVRYLVGDLWAYAKRHTIDPEKLREQGGMALGAYLQSRGSARDRVAHEAGSQVLDSPVMDEIVEDDSADAPSGKGA